LLNSVNVPYCRPNVSGSKWLTSISVYPKKLPSSLGGEVFVVVTQTRTSAEHDLRGLAFRLDGTEGAKQCVLPQIADCGLESSAGSDLWPATWRLDRERRRRSDAARSHPDGRILMALRVFGAAGLRPEMSAASVLLADRIMAAVCAADCGMAPAGREALIGCMKTPIENE
jgi:hypothetical protein